MVFYKNTSDLSEKILRISSDDKLRKNIAKRGKLKYMKYFNSDLVSKYIIDKIIGVKSNKKYLWKNKKALITGITGQDGSYLAEFLLKKNTKFRFSSEEWL